MFKRKTARMKSEFQSVHALEDIQLGGVKQTILIRGENVDNPVMLFLHGGPGTAQIGFAPKFQGSLEKDFVVVNWDQRGSGLSYSPDASPENLTIDTMLSDTLELIAYLLKRFNHPKLFLVGHSWGTVLSTLASQQVPESIYAYIGIGQVVNMREGEKLSYEYTIEKAKELKKEKALKALTSIPFDPANMKYLGVQRNWLTKLGGSYLGVSMYKLIYSNMLFATEYTLKDWFRYIRAVKLSLETLWPQLIEIDFFSAVPKLSVPVYIFAGRFDYQTPFQLAEQYFHALDCPRKQFVWFEHSAHLPNYEEPDKFYEECLAVKQAVFA